MATQSIASCSVFEAKSFIRGYHDYMHLWMPRAGEVLTLQREPQNTVDQHAVAVIKKQSSCWTRTLHSGSVVFPLFEEVLQQRHGRSYWGQGKPWRWLQTRNTMKVSLVWP